MGGRGSQSRITMGRNPQALTPPAPQPQPPQQPAPITQQVPDDTNTPVTPDILASLSQMSDAQLAQAFIASQKTALPNHLDDKSDITQKFVFHIGLNDKPMVLDDNAFKKFMADNNIPQAQVLARGIGGGVLKTSAGGQRKLSPKDVSDMMMYSRLNYVGGKQGGQAYGAGTYFNMNGGKPTGYGGSGGMLVKAVLNPSTAKIITDTALRSKAAAFDRTHPQFARATGGYKMSFFNNNMSVYALAMGYNVIKDSSSGYHNVIDRKALVYKK